METTTSTAADHQQTAALFSPRTTRRRHRQAHTQTRNRNAAQRALQLLQQRLEEEQLLHQHQHHEQQQRKHAAAQSRGGHHHGKQQQYPQLLPPPASPLPSGREVRPHNNKQKHQHPLIMMSSSLQTSTHHRSSNNKQLVLFNHHGASPRRSHHHMYGSSICSSSTTDNHHDRQLTSLLHVHTTTGMALPHTPMPVPSHTMTRSQTAIERAEYEEAVIAGVADEPPAILISALDHFEDDEAYSSAEEGDLAVVATTRHQQQSAAAAAGTNLPGGAGHRNSIKSALKKRHHVKPSSSACINMVHNHLYKHTQGLERRVKLTKMSIDVYLGRKSGKKGDKRKRTQKKHRPAATILRPELGPLVALPAAQQMHHETSDSLLALQQRQPWRRTRQRSGTAIIESHPAEHIVIRAGQVQDRSAASQAATAAAAEQEKRNQNAVAVVTQVRGKEQNEHAPPRMVPPHPIQSPYVAQIQMAPPAFVVEQEDTVIDIPARDTLYTLPGIRSRRHVGREEKKKVEADSSYPYFHDEDTPQFIVRRRRPGRFGASAATLSGPSLATQQSSQLDRRSLSDEGTVSFPVLKRSPKRRSMKPAWNSLSVGGLDAQPGKIEPVTVAGQNAHGNGRTDDAENDPVLGDDDDAAGRAGPEVNKQPRPPLLDSVDPNEVAEMGFAPEDYGKDDMAVPLALDAAATGESGKKSERAPVSQEMQGQGVPAVPAGTQQVMKGDDHTEDAVAAEKDVKTEEAVPAHASRPADSGGATVEEEAGSPAADPVIDAVSDEGKGPMIVMDDGDEKREMKVLGSDDPSPDEMIDMTDGASDTAGADDDRASVSPPTAASGEKIADISPADAVVVENGSDQKQEAVAKVITAEEREEVGDVLKDSFVQSMFVQAVEAVDVSAEQASQLIAVSGSSAEAARMHIEHLNLQHVKVSNVEDLILEVKYAQEDMAAEMDTLLAVMQAAEKSNFLDLNCPITIDIVRDIYVRGRCGPETMATVEEFLRENRSFPSREAMIEALRASHEAHVEKAKGSQLIMLCFLRRPRRSIFVQPLKRLFRMEIDRFLEVEGFEAQAVMRHLELIQDRNEMVEDTAELLDHVNRLHNRRLNVIDSLVSMINDPLSRIRNEEWLTSGPCSRDSARSIFDGAGGHYSIEALSGAVNDGRSFSNIEELLGWVQNFCRSQLNERHGVILQQEMVGFQARAEPTLRLKLNSALLGDAAGKVAVSVLIGQGGDGVEMTYVGSMRSVAPNEAAKKDGSVIVEIPLASYLSEAISPPAPTLMAGALARRDALPEAERARVVEALLRKEMRTKSFAGANVIDSVAYTTPSEADASGDVNAALEDRSLMEEYVARVSAVLDKVKVMVRVFDISADESTLHSVGYSAAALGETLFSVSDIVNADFAHFEDEREVYTNLRLSPLVALTKRIGSFYAFAEPVPSVATVNDLCAGKVPSDTDATGKASALGHFVQWSPDASQTFDSQFKVPFRIDGAVTTLCMCASIAMRANVE